MMSMYTIMEQHTYGRPEVMNPVQSNHLFHPLATPERTSALTSRVYMLIMDGEMNE